MADSGCSLQTSALCWNPSFSLHLKIIAIFVILVACVAGVCLPLLGRSFSVLKPESNFFFVVKSFAAGVILATGFVHMLPDAFNSLTNPCLPPHPWSKFPFAGFVAMMAALLTLMIDCWGTAFYARNHRINGHMTPDKPGDDTVAQELIDGVTPRDVIHSSDNLSMVTIHAHASSHAVPPQCKTVHQHEHRQGVSSGDGSPSGESSQLRHRVISQVLEVGIVAHSVIIGMSMGTSQSPCTIRPLIAALTFHQFFEGLALGGCIAQAGFQFGAAALMAFFFSITTPTGIAIGIAITSSYNENSPTALAVEGVFDSMSAGILVYMSLVDLIATDFLSKRLQSNLKLQFHSYTALFLGAGAMSLIAIWA